MTVNDIINEINALLKMLPQELYIGVLDEDGNDTDLKLDSFVYENDCDENEAVNAWCHQI